MSSCGGNEGRKATIKRSVSHTVSHDTATVIIEDGESEGRESYSESHDTSFSKDGNMFKVRISCKNFMDAAFADTSFSKNGDSTIRQIIKYHNHLYSVKVWKNEKELFEFKADKKRMVELKFMEKDNMMILPELLRYNSRNDLFIFRQFWAVAESDVGGEAFFILDSKGKLLLHDDNTCNFCSCKSPIQFTGDDKYMLTCHDIIDLGKVSKKNFSKTQIGAESIALLNHSSFLAIHFHQEDSTSDNAFINDIHGSKIKSFSCEAFGKIPAGMGMYAGVTYAPILNAIDVYDCRERKLICIDTANLDITNIYLSQLKIADISDEKQLSNFVLPIDTTEIIFYHDQSKILSYKIRSLNH